MAGGDRRGRHDGREGTGEEVKGPPLNPLRESGRGSPAASSLRLRGDVRARHDGFTPARQKTFFKTLRKTGCLADACRVAGVSTNTARRWRDKDKGFDDRVAAALAIASNGLEAIAFKRATEGAEEKVYRDGKLVMTRVKPSDSMLRLLMQGANGGKYGRTGQMPKKEVMKILRAEAKADFLAEQTVSEEELCEVLMKHLDALKRRQLREMLGQGYSVGPNGILVPAGWRMVPDLPALPPPPGDEE